MHTQSEEARTALTALASLDIAPERSASIARAIVTLDRELDEAHTMLVKAQSMVKAVVDWDASQHMSAYACARLTPRETAILEALLMANGRVMSQQGLLTYLYNGQPDTPELKIIDVFICKIRRKLQQVRDYLKATGVPHEIETSWGRGYRLKPVQAHCSATG